MVKRLLVLLLNCNILKSLGGTKSCLFTELLDVAFVKDRNSSFATSLDISAASVSLEHGKTLLDRHRLELDDCALPDFLLLNEFLYFDLLQADLSELVELFLVFLSDFLKIFLSDLAVCKLLINNVLTFNEGVLTL